LLKVGLRTDSMPRIFLVAKELLRLKCGRCREADLRLMLLGWAAVWTILLATQMP
jgi:hypothetical protein